MAESNIISDTLLNEKNTIIDATQNAIITVAEDVSAVLSPTNQEIPLTSPFYTEIEFWVGMSFVLVVIFFGKLAYKFIKSALIKRINNITSDIEEAIKLRDDAQIALSNYEKKTKNTDKEVAEIIAKAQKNIIAFEEKELRKLKINSEMKEKEIDQRISSSIDTVTKELKDLISTESINLVEKSIIKYATEEEHSKLIDDVIENLDKIEIKFY